MKSDATIGIVCFAMIIAYFTGLLVEQKWPSKRNALRVEAVQHGAARWGVSVEGRTTFKWNDEAPR